MASFQNPSYIQQFTPPTPQFNTELYGNILTQKQSQYDQNLDKVIGYRDSVAGLKVGREIDSQYLTQKVTELNSSIQQQIGGDADWSNTQTVRQAGGLAAQIYADKNIQNAVISAQNYADASAQIQEAHKSGKSSVTNDHAVMRNIKAWQQGGLDTTLGKQQYTNFFDYQKGFQDFMKDKHGNVIVEQLPSSTKKDENGKDIPDWTAYALVEGKRVSLDPLAVQQDAQTYFASNAQAKGQLDIDTLYYTDTTPDHIVLNQYRQVGEMELRRIDSQLKEYQTNLKLYPAQSAEIQAKMSQYEQARTKQVMKNQRIEEEFYRDPYAAKASLFQQDVLNGFANRYAYQDIESKIVKNPYRDAMMDEAQLSLQQQKFAWEQESWTKKFNQDERKMANDIKAAQIASGALLGGGQYDAAFAENYTPEQYIDDVKRENETVGQQQLALMYKIDPTNIILGEDSEGNPLYRTKPGYTQNQRQQDWNKISASYYSDPQAANSDVARYFGSQFSEDYGLGKEKAVQAKMKEINNIETRLKQNFENNPEYQSYLQKVNKLGSPNQVLLQEGNTQITRDDLRKFAEADLPTIYNPETSARLTGLPAQKVQLLHRIVRGETGSFLKDLATAPTFMLAKAGVGGDSPAGQLRKEYDRINSLRTSVTKQFQQARKAAFQNTVLNESSSRITEKLTDKNPQGIALLKGKLDSSDPEGAERVNTVLAEKGDAFLTVQRSPTSGKFSAIVSKGGKTEVFDLTSAEAAQMAPQLVVPNKYSGQEALIRANANGRRGVPSTTGSNGFTSYTPERTNLQKIQLRYQIDYNGDGEVGYKPNIQYKIKGTDEWIQLPIDPRYSDLEKANELVEQLASRDDTYFYNTFLKQ